jgi:di/tricarboxylate transporter
MADLLNLFPAEAWQTLGVLLVLFITLLFTSLPADMVFMGGIAVLMLIGVAAPEEAFTGFSSPALFTVGALYVVVAGLQETGGLKWLSTRVLGRPTEEGRARLRLTLPIAFLSAFMNNTPVVALFIPVVQTWCRRNQFLISRFLIPLSYASILGGMCTLIGSSTNLVINSMYIRTGAEEGLSIFSVTLLGVPCALAGLGYLYVFGGRLLPGREAPQAAEKLTRSYTVEMEVMEGALVGKTLEETDLHDIHEARFVQLLRGETILTHQPLETPLVAGDHLLFTGPVGAISQLRTIRGLKLSASRFKNTYEGTDQRQVVEAVVSHTCPMVGLTLQDGEFQRVYNAVVIAIARNGGQLRGSLKDTSLKAGDVLLVECHAGFVPRQMESGDFYLLHTLDDTLWKTPSAKAPIAFAILVIMLLLAGTHTLSMLKASLFAAGAMLMTGCCTAATARRRIEWNVLMVIGAALGLGAILESTGGAQGIADLLLGLSGGNPWITLALVYLNTVLFTEIITNNAAVALVFPIAMSTATQMGVNPLPFLFCVMIGGSASFATPIGYQTNLMVYGAGNYRFSDYLRIGIPLGILVGVIAVGLAPLIWPF